MTRPVLMTGASGFVGRAVAARLVETGVPVVSFGRSAPGFAGVVHLDGDIARPQAVGAVVDRLRPRAILALASAPPAAPGERHAAVTLGAALAILDAAGRVEGCRFVGIGSAAEFGAAESPALPAEEAPRRPETAYGEAKANLMDAIGAAAASGDDAVGLRLFAAIGPDMPAHSLLGSVARQLRDPDRRVISTGPLDGERDYLPVETVARLMAALALAPSRLPDWINVGSGRGVGLRDLVAATLRLSGRAVDGLEERADGPARGRRIVADIGRLRSLGHEVAAPTIETLAALALGAAAPAGRR